MENMESQVTPTKPMEEQIQTPTQGTPKQEPTKPALSCIKIKLFVNLVSRILTSIFLLMALVLLATTSKTLAVKVENKNINFKDMSYRYRMVVFVIGLVYTTVQSGFVVYQVITERRLFNGKSMLVFGFCADKVLSGILATGAGAGLGISIDMKDNFSTLTRFFNKGALVSSFVLFAYVFNEVAQIVSSYAPLQTTNQSLNHL